MKIIDSESKMSSWLIVGIQKRRELKVKDKPKTTKYTWGVDR